MNAHVGQFSSTQDFFCRQLFFAFGKCWNMQPRAIEANTLRDIEASVSKHNITRTQVIENAAMFCDMFITAAPTPSL